jgi:hypothetical protein
MNGLSPIRAVFDHACFALEHWHDSQEPVRPRCGVSERAGGPFVGVNCGAIPAELVENELFGHVGGAFTGARARADGLVAEAEGGTLFLDEWTPSRRATRSRCSVSCRRRSTAGRASRACAAPTRAARSVGKARRTSFASMRKHKISAQRIG